VISWLKKKKTLSGLLLRLNEAPAKVKVFHRERTALAQESSWRKNMNLDYDDTGVFEVPLEANDPPLESI